MKLLQSISLGGIPLKNSIAMAAMTRSRAGLYGVVTELTKEYYLQRSSAGLIISEGLNISQGALGSPYTPGIFTQRQIEAWMEVTQAIHEKGSIIYAQLWHTGRVGHSLDRNGEQPVAPSPIAIEGQHHFTSRGLMEYERPTELSKKEIAQIILDYRQAAINAIHAGFDGVQLHAAFGYLPNEFLAESANHRTDSYGGSVENRNRFVIEIMESLIEVLGKDKVGIKISPNMTFNNIIHENPVAQFEPLLQKLNEMPLSFIELVTTGPKDQPHYPQDVMATYGPMSKHIVIANGSYTKESGEHELERGIAKMISYGTLFLANPDLPQRFEHNAPLNQADRATMFGGTEKGYTDYPYWNKNDQNLLKQ